METIRILLYTDYSYISENINLWGLTSLQRFIKLKLQGIAHVEFSLMNRHFDYVNNQPNVDGATRLTPELLDRHDELWVFGALQMNTTAHPHNELDDVEVAALRAWMQTGGVMVTGDHSNGVGNMTCRSDHRNFVNMGAALGRRIPRAGELRAWDGPPTGCYSVPLAERDNHNTHEGQNPANLDDPLLQTDVNPLTLRVTFDNPPHRLFWWYLDPQSQEVVPISKFPDHIHEGELRIPSPLGGDWPASSPAPVIAAQGRDNRYPAEQRLYNLVVAYDGHAANVGRIVADSSFHHYIDRNLLRIPARLTNRDPVPGSDLDQIAQYYCNLALWLAPKKIRERIGWGLFFWAARHPDVIEDKMNEPHVIGRTALSVLEQEIGTSNLYRLLAPSEDEPDSKLMNTLLSTIFLGDKSPAKLSFIEPEQSLGHIAQEYHRFFEERQLLDPGWFERDPAPPEVVLEGLTRASEKQSDKFGEFLSEFRALAESFRVERYADEPEVKEEKEEDDSKSV